MSLTRKRLLYAVVSQTFRQLIDNAGIGAGAPSPPRLHDLRHTFAVRTLLGWYRAGEDVQAKIPSLSTYLGHREPSVHLLVPVGRPGTARAGRRPPGHRVVGGPVMTLIAPTLQAFFTDRLVQQRQASPRTIAAYRDTLRLLLGFVHQQTGKMPAQLDWDDLDATMISAFLNHLESERHNSIRTRNVRLTAIRSLFSYAALRHPEHALLIQRVLAIPPKRFDKRIVTFLTATGDRRPDRRPGPGPLGRPTRPGPDAAGRPDRPAGLRTHRPELRRRHPRHRRQRPLRRQGTQATRRPPHQPRRGAAAALAQPNEPDAPAIRCSPPAPDGGSAATPSRCGSAPTPRPPHSDARRCWASESTHTSCATAAPCRCCKPASTPP